MAQTAFSHVIRETAAHCFGKQRTEIAGGQTAGPGCVLQTKLGVGMMSLHIFEPRLKAPLRLAQLHGFALTEQTKQQREQENE